MAAIVHPIPTLVNAKESWVVGQYDVHSYLIMGLRKLLARLSDSDAVRRSITPHEETAIVKIPGHSHRDAHPSKDAKDGPAARRAEGHADSICLTRPWKGRS